MKSIIVFCGASEGNQPVYRETAYKLGAEFARRKIVAVYGGARIGLMGAFADGVLDHGGEITGVIPYFLESREIAHKGLTQLIKVKSMHDRKLLMYEMGDAVIAMPGGWGTMDELFEMLTWGQIGLHSKPIGILNINGYYNSLKALCATMVQEGFLNEHYMDNVLISDSIDDLLEQIENYVPGSNT